MSTKRKSKTRKWLVVSIIVIAVAVIAGAVLKRPAAAAYESVNAKTGDITTYYSFSGNVETKNRQTVMAEKILQISDIKVEEGDTVTEGEVLLTTTAGDEIKSKINGEIVKINVEDNAQVMAGTALLDIVDYNLELNVKVDEYDIHALAPGKETTVKIGAINKEMTGKISSISNEGQIMNGITFFMATIDLAKDEDLKIGMSAEVKVISNKAAGVVTLPMTAIQFDDNNQPYVLKKDQNGAEVKTEITTGINDGTTVEVKSGVANGETILYKKAAAASTGAGFGGGGGNANGSDGGGNE
ncbi:HlyD family secretion protein [Paenibacillus sophorae]|uniref:Efflux RND transporter periplasmic adaptor subunit n=1 Tax=Paenibacillus sophorae TaxID=1333845 RepID=A0A1H8FEB7_9BACL|nr:HlyD family efflux transporter periplasmic adaptor subunit [Paenibacillus sophorae]QWU13846.1 efflux RND transporter periplasmic adaptor subunit [Paenibacillus sophorae]SEN29955.1 HlyD family secretion protein [Paenibacillus sophorae]